MSGINRHHLTLEKTDRNFPQYGLAHIPKLTLEALDKGFLSRDVQESPVQLNAIYKKLASGLIKNAAQALGKQPFYYCSRARYAVDCRSRWEETHTETA